jgi:deoxyribodipyrimidine photo-lyase
MASTPAARVRVCNEAPVNANGAFVLYWMTSARRAGWNFGLQHAAELARGLRKPLVILEALRCEYPWASDRLHRFVLDGMTDNAAAVGVRARYYPYVEPAPGAGRGLIRELSKTACAIVTDEYPAFFLPRMIEAAARQSSVRLESVDSNGILPLSVHGRAFPTARGYRAFMQRELRRHLPDVPDEDPLRNLPAAGTDPLPAAVRARWPEADPARVSLASLPIDHAVAPAPVPGGSVAARGALQAFVGERLARYAADHNHPDADATSRLSPCLHFGHLSAHEVFAAVMTAERWTTRKLRKGGGGAREGWWGVSPSA